MAWGARLLVPIVLASCFPAAIAAETHVSTLAGSGTTAFGDGPATAASFMLPMGIAFDGAGDLYVADAAAQRIRKLSNGTVRTIAGGGTPDASNVWVPGGYVDGAGAAARFNRPAALAVARDGRVYVADSSNHCIRVVAPDGTVSTFAGSPARPGFRTGSRETAEFMFPTGLALDRAENLYVVDSMLGGAVRKIEPSGVVSELKVAGLQPTGGIAAAGGPGGTTLFLADGAGMIVRHPDGSLSTFRNRFFATKCAGRLAPSWVACDQPATALRAHGDIGAPGSIAAYTDHTIAYTDFRTNSVRYLDVRSSTVRLLAGYALDDGSGHGGGSQDGAGSAATFNAPLGIAIDPRGDLAVADAGSRRVRLVRGVERTEPLFAGDLRGAARAPGPMLIAYAGDAGVWQGTEWADSIEGRLQRRLNDGGCSRCRSIEVVPVVLDPFAGGVTALSSLTDRRFDAVVLHVTPNDRDAPLATAVRRLAGALKARGARLVLVAQPLPADVAPAMSLWARGRTTVLGEPSGFGRLKAELAATGVPLIDTSAAFAAAASAPMPPALYATGDEELASGGRETVAAAVANALLTMRPW